MCTLGQKLGECIYLSYLSETFREKSLIPQTYVRQTKELHQKKAVSELLFCGIICVYSKSFPDYVT